MKPNVRGWCCQFLVRSFIQYYIQHENPWRFNRDSHRLLVQVSQSSSYHRRVLRREDSTMTEDYRLLRRLMFWTNLLFERVSYFFTLLKSERRRVAVAACELITMYNRIKVVKLFNYESKKKTQQLPFYHLMWTRCQVSRSPVRYEICDSNKNDYQDAFSSESWSW